MKQLLQIACLSTVLALLSPAFSWAATPEGAGTDLAKSRTDANDGSKLGDDDLKRLLEQRVPGGLGVPFGQLSKGFLVSSHRETSKPISIVTNSDKIAKTTLRSNYPSFYKPTLKEFFDSIAVQTFSQWKYDPSGKFIDNKSKDKKADKEIVVFEFSEQAHKKPYELSLAKGWSTKDNGNWVMCTPPGESVGMDIYELGGFSSINKGNEAELFKQVPYEVAMEWAQRVQPKAKKTDMKPSRVGEYEAVFFESKVKTQTKKDVHWRQWVFMAGNQCFFIVSTIYPESENKIYPEVESMLRTFRLRK